MEKKENNFAFIDSQNLNLSIRNQGWLLDYKKFRKKTNGGQTPKLTFQEGK